MAVHWAFLTAASKAPKRVGSMAPWRVVKWAALKESRKAGHSASLMAVMMDVHLVAALVPKRADSRA